MTLINICTLFAAFCCTLAMAQAYDGILLQGLGAGPANGLIFDIQEFQAQAHAVANNFLQHTALPMAMPAAAPIQQTTMPSGTSTAPRQVPLNRIQQTMASAHSLKPEMEALLKIGILLHTIDTYRDDMQQMIDRNNAEYEKVKDHLDAPPATEYMVEIADGNFMVGDHGDCRKIFVSGTNKYEMVEAGAGAPFLFDGKLVQKGLVGPAVVRRVMMDAQDQGIDFIRINAFAVDSEFSAITGVDDTVAPILNEDILKGLDYVVDQARLHGLKVILVLTDYFADRAGGPLQYMSLAGQIPSEEAPALTKAHFYGNGPAKEIWKQYISALANRINTYNGRTYKTDPAIFGWDIMNEPRCEGDICQDSPPDIYSFVSEMYDYLKNAAYVEQPVTIGTDGFFSQGPFSGVYDSTPTAVNPYNEPATSLIDFTTICAMVDFCEFNTYPDLWDQENAGWVKAWVAAHSAAAISLGKPVIVKEQGMQPTDKRSEFFKIMYTTDYVQIKADQDKVGGLKGAAYWQAWATGTKAIFHTLAIGGRFGILANDPEIPAITLFSQKVGLLSAKKIAGDTCPAALEGTDWVLPPPTCSEGYAGVGCDDIDECVLGLDACSVHASCINTEGSYRCDCFRGYYGNGKLCMELPIALHRIEESYYTKDTLSCVDGSQTVPYPIYAPGYVEDPTGYFTTNSESRIPVTLTECKIACTMATGCSSFYFDPIQGKCILKSNECPYTQPSVSGCAPAECEKTDCSAPNVSICDKEVYVKNSPEPPTPGTYECTRGITYFKKKFPYGETNPLCQAPVAP